MQLSGILQGYALPESWAVELEKRLAEDERKLAQTSGVFVASAQTRLANLQSKLQRLLDSYLDQDIDQQTYRAKQADLMSEKKSLDEQVSKHTLATNVWVEPMRNWLKLAVSLCEIANNGSLLAKKEALLQIDGLDLFLKTKKAQPTAAQNISPPLKNQWTALRAALQLAASRRKIEKSFLMVPLYDEARTYFERNV
jgi:uncharacterized coiled-coil protein SlyX